MLTAYWHVIHTKPRQEQRALLNLQQQGYTCYLPLFARYLFIQLDTAHTGQSWGPIRSTLGVSRLVTFGTEPAKASAELIDSLRTEAASIHTPPKRLFTPGDRVQIKDGPFMGLEGIYHMDDGERRAMVLMELLSKPCKLSFEPGNLRKL